MSRLTSIIVLVLAGIWLPATLHCDLEGVGAFGGLFGCATGADESQSDSDCGDCVGDACETIEDGAYRPSSAVVQAPLPAVDFIRLPIVDGGAGAPRVTPRGGSNGGPDDWLACWHFVRRDAPPARAPA